MKRIIRSLIYLRLKAYRKVLFYGRIMHLKRVRVKSEVRLKRDNYNGSSFEGT
jgi:hypothetical protein